MTFKIEKGVPLSRPKHNQAMGDYDEVFETMGKLKVDESFFWPTPEGVALESHRQTVAYIRSKAPSIPGNAEKVFTTRRRTEDKRDGFRIWRTK